MPLHRHASRLCAAPICLYSLKSLLYIACGQLKRDRFCRQRGQKRMRGSFISRICRYIRCGRDIVLTPRLDSSLAGCLKQRPLVHIALRAFCAVSAAAQRGRSIRTSTSPVADCSISDGREVSFTPSVSASAAERKPGLFYLVAILTRRRKLLRRELQDLGYEQKLVGIGGSRTYFPSYARTECAHAPGMLVDNNNAVRHLYKHISVCGDTDYAIIYGHMRCIVSGDGADRRCTGIYPGSSSRIQPRRRVTQDIIVARIRAASTARAISFIRYVAGDLRSRCRSRTLRYPYRMPTTLRERLPTCVTRTDRAPG